MLRVQTMKNVDFYLDELAKHTETGSDYAIAKLLNVKPNRISNYRTGRHVFDDEMCIKIGGLLDIEPLEIIASMNALRSKSEKQKKFWEKTYERITGTAASVILALALVAGLGSPSTSYAHFKFNAEYRLCALRRLRAVLGLFLAAVSFAPAQAGEWFQEIGLAVHATGLDRPEVTLENPLLVYGIGWRAPGLAGRPLVIKYQHHSGLFQTESGYGYNVISVTQEF